MSNADTALFPPASEEAIVVLASQSPNRKLLCEQMGLKPVIRISDFEENLPKDLPVREFVEQTAKGKLEVVEKEMREKGEPFDVIIAADTVIYFEEIIGKPADAQDAINTLKKLRNETHYVYTGIALAFKNGNHELFSVETKVLCGDYSDELIEKYVATGEPLNKAGSYSVFNRGAVFVRSIDGCFSNVVGLPISALSEALTKNGINIF